ncbi:hypothetical protein MKI84_15555 [Ancylobacter sp. A5.8]|uniref:AbiU2 domain-containing protein n=1 Tax=Ancylobacter gelatini TaxID=2919920 RepID=UPI001F4ED390|nr:hypothetical protein [Ancylobacter gelatini]MCJ8144338.1 hypothetical protein [Ancylobacter gelatini]
MAKKRRPVRITNVEALRRLERMAPLILEDVQIALAAGTSLAAANDLVTATANTARPGAVVYRTIQQSLTLSLATSLARLFDHGTLSRHPNTRDVASLPLMVRLLKQKRNQGALIKRARRWTPMQPDLEDMHVAACMTAIEGAIARYDVFARSREGKAILGRLKRFRDGRLAHALMEETRDAQPLYHHLFGLTAVARGVASSAALAIKGRSPSLTAVESIWRRHAELFWAAALDHDGERAGSAQN